MDRPAWANQNESLLKSLLPPPRKIKSSINDLNMLSAARFHANIVKLTRCGSKHCFCFTKRKLCLLQQLFGSTHVHSTAEQQPEFSLSRTRRMSKSYTEMLHFPALPKCKHKSFYRLLLGEGAGKMEDTPEKKLKNSLHQKTANLGRLGHVLS